MQTVSEAVLDGDADGLHDAWEITHFGSTENADPGTDDDGDGRVNRDEFVAGTLPGDANSFFRVERIERLDAINGFRISWTAVPGRSYAIDWTNDLRNPFVPIAVDLPGGSYIDTHHSASHAGFYRVRVELE
jgi:hypothetical protein